MCFAYDGLVHQTMDGGRCTRQSSDVLAVLLQLDGALTSVSEVHRNTLLGVGVGDKESRGIVIDAHRTLVRCMAVLAFGFSTPVYVT